MQAWIAPTAPTSRRGESVRCVSGGRGRGLSRGGRLRP